MTELSEYVTGELNCLELEITTAEVASNPEHAFLNQPTSFDQFSSPLYWVVISFAASLTRKCHRHIMADRH